MKEGDCWRAAATQQRRKGEEVGSRLVSAQGCSEAAQCSWASRAGGQQESGSNPSSAFTSVGLSVRMWYKCLWPLHEATRKRQSFCYPEGLPTNTHLPSSALPSTSDCPAFFFPCICPSVGTNVRVSLFSGFILTGPQVLRWSICLH